MSKFDYRGWTVIPNALPTADHRWSASCDLARVNGDGEEVFEAATMQFDRDTQEAAIAAACDEARIQIDNLVADPQVRLA